MRYRRGRSSRRRSSSRRRRSSVSRKRRVRPVRVGFRF